MRRLLFILFILAFGLAAACGNDEDALRVDLSKRKVLIASPRSNALTYAYLPQYSHTVSYRRHNRMVAYLQQATGIPMRQVFPDTFDEHVKMIERGEIDISFSNPFIYIQIARLGARAFARVVEPSGSPSFSGQIICRSDNTSIRTLDDCRGKRWIAVDPSSAGGYLFALGLFHDHDLLPHDFSEIAFAPGPGGKQEKVVLAVHAGKFDIGSIRTGTLDIVKNKIEMKNIRVLTQTRSYPGWVYAARKGLDQAVVDRIAKALFALSMDDPVEKNILETAGIRGVIPADNADYDPVRDLAAKLGLSGGDQ
ncbi:MAG: phosphate/phosphite/phosphonate ABC transporter substrate-binding protein [Desulfovibrio sp.]|uniref:phosphate/phosphite/phosphonate ABC transporter substrate-binding protein n=1 Tax=Desulfovibrio sp. 7SRBS1 TaxID=3378064 RepID=UPI003B401CBF